MHDFILLFHGLGTPDRDFEPGEEPYWISSMKFERFLDVVVQHPQRSRLRIMFDDGNRSDYSIALPALARRGLQANMFVLAGKVGQRGYLSRDDIQALAAQGHAIGSHGMDHVNWCTLDAPALAREVEQSRALLEDIVQQSIQSVAIPFGIYNRQVLNALRHAGYRHIYSSDRGPRLTRAAPIPRFSIRQGMGPDDVRQIINRSMGLGARLITELRVQAKCLR